jgi:uncharacterized protein
MGLMGYTPLFEADGANAGLINSRLIRWERVDAAGLESDRLMLVVDTEGLDGLPSDGGVIHWREGYAETGLWDKGAFRVTRTTPQLFPMAMKIVATAAPFEAPDETAYRERRSASYGPTTLGEIFRQLVRKHSFEPRIAPELDIITVGHVDQADETDFGFLTRLAGKYDAVTKPVDDLYVLALRGQIKSVSGQQLESLTLSVPQNNLPGAGSFVNASVDRSGRQEFAGVRASWYDDEAAKAVTVEAGEKPFKTLRQQYQSEAEAQAAAQGEQRKLTRKAAKLTVDAPGDPRFVAEGLIILDDTWPSHMRGTWSVDKVTARGEKSGYRCRIEATWPEGHED